ncbi:MAG: geranylgeranyl reductase family protein [Silvibacterium sp.]
MKLWDAIVVGAGPAGCAAAYDLALAGREVLLLDRAEFPRQKACAGGLTLKTVRALRYSVEPIIRQQISHVRLEPDASQATVLRRRSTYCFMTVRRELDDYCFRQTLAVGAKFQRIRAITAISEDSSGVAITFDGQPLQTRFLIGADGVHSRVRQLTSGDAGWFWRAFALEATIPLTNAAEHDLIFDFAPVRDGYGWIFPKGDHINIGLYSYASEEKIDRARLAAYIRNRRGDATAADVIGQYAGFGAAQHKIGATRIFLTGDAGGFVDPLTGEGIYFAIASGQAAAAAIEANLSSDTCAHRYFAQVTARIREDLRISTSAARWFYANLDQGCRLLAMPLLRTAALNAFANGLGIAKLALRAKKLLRLASTS